ncbi:hypothetical protein F4781DRAFT_430431 [Annulohypoxylon bovei var. microspora]|nr:hypothetical protein F4781DRAFT_430431 [Annulohypoxylon bovei var. microspora]
MESMTIQRKATLDSSFPLRTLQPQSSQLNFGRLPSPFGFKGADGAIRRTPIPEPPYSPISVSSRTSFSQASSADSWEVISTAPSSPQTPRPKYELDEIPKLELIPPHRGSLKHRRDSLDETTKKTKLPLVELPSLNYLLPLADNKNRRPSSHSRVKGPLNSTYSSPEPNNEYTFSSKPAYSPSEDPIVRYLNLWRKESGDTKSNLSQPRNQEGTSLLNINLDFCDPAPVLYREKQQYTPQLRDYCHRPCQQPSSGVVKKESKEDQVDAKAPHNNVKYTLEEMDYIRFCRYEMKLSWEEGKSLFREKFPMANAEMDRGTQGIQGVHYRDNAHLPRLVDEGRKLVFLPNGHVEAVGVKVRFQREAKLYFSLTYLYPERALLYDWVPLKVKQFAAQLVKERTAQREAKKREAIIRKTDKDDCGQCACCPKPDRKRDDDKRFTPKPLARHRLPRPTQIRGQRRLFGSRDLARTGMDMAVYTREQFHAEAKRRKFESVNV